MCIRDCESRTLKADLCSAVARQASVLRGDGWQRETGREHRSVGSDEPSAEVEMADAGRAGASATAIEISHPTIWSARPSRDAARMRPLLHFPARLRLSRCQIRLGEHPPPPQIYPQGQQPAGARRDAALRCGRLLAASARFSQSCAP